MADIGGGWTFTPDDPQTYTLTNGPNPFAPEPGALLTTFSTTRLTIPPYLTVECFIFTAPIPAGGTAADQRQLIENCLFDKKTSLQLSLVNGGTVTAGTGGWEWLQGRLSAPKSDTRQTTAFALKSTNTGAPNALEILIGCTASYLHVNVGDLAAIDATTLVTNGLISCLTPPS
jgi:hypothetical protein